MYWRARSEPSVPLTRGPISTSARRCSQALSLEKSLSTRFDGGDEFQPVLVERAERLAAPIDVIEYSELHDSPPSISDYRLIPVAIHLCMARMGHATYFGKIGYRHLSSFLVIFVHL